MTLVSRDDALKHGATVPIGECDDAAAVGIFGFIHLQCANRIHALHHHFSIRLSHDNTAAIYASGVAGVDIVSRGMSSPTKARPLLKIEFKSAIIIVAELSVMYFVVTIKGVIGILQHTFVDIGTALRWRWHGKPLTVDTTETIIRVAAHDVAAIAALAYGYILAHSPNAVVESASHHSFFWRALGIAHEGARHVILLT